MSRYDCSNDVDDGAGGAVMMMMDASFLLKS